MNNIQELQKTRPKTQCGPKSLPAVPPDTYRRGFSLFSDRLPLEFSNRAQGLTSTLTVPTPRVLSVGCGDGSFESLLCQVYPSIECMTLIEPNSGHVERLRASLDSFSGCTTSVFEGTWEAFQSQSSDSNYDLIIFCHSIYYIADPLNAIQHARERLSPDGKVYVFIANDCMSKISREVNTHSPHDLNSDVLSDLVSDAKVPFTMSSIITECDLTDVPNLSEADQRDILSFFASGDCSSESSLFISTMVNRILTAYCVLKNQRYILHTQTDMFSFPPSS